MSCTTVHIGHLCGRPRCRHWTTYFFSYLLNRTFFITYLLTYLLTPWCRDLLQKLTGSQLVKKFPTFYGTRRFITAFTSGSHLSLYWANSMQSTSIFLNIHLNIILPSTPGSPKLSLYLRFPHHNTAYNFSLPHTRYMSRPPHFLDFYTRKIFGERYKSLSYSLCPISSPFFVAWVAPMYQSRSEVYSLTVSQQDKVFTARSC